MLLVKTKLNSIKVSTSKILTDLYISYDKLFLLVNDVLIEDDGIKGRIKNLKT